MRSPAGLLIVCCLLASPSWARQDEPVDTPRETARPETAVLSGRVTLKDGVTPFAGAKLMLADTSGPALFQEKSSRNGRFRFRVPVGSYTVRIVRGADMYTSASVYRVSAGVRNSVDFLVIPHFEAPSDSDAAARAEKRGPDAVAAAPIEVGSIVDVIHAQPEGRWRRWGELLGFIGSLLVVILAAG